MNSSEAARDTTMANADAACPLFSPLAARIPGLLSIAVVPGAIMVSPFFFGLAGGLLAFIGLLLSPPRSRSLGVVGLMGAVVASSLGIFVPR